MILQERWYQNNAEQSIYNYFASKQGNPVLAMPTASGKAVVIAKFIRNLLQKWPNQRIIIATHVKELVAQNYNKIIDAWPDAPAGIYSAGLKQRDIVAPVIFGNIQSMNKKVRLFGHRDLLIVDECHLISGKDNSNYGRFINGLKAINPALKVIGFSATHWRMGHGLISDGPIFTDVCYDLTTIESFQRLISEGFLSLLIPKKTSTVLDVSKIKIKNGEYDLKQQEEEFDRDPITYAACQEIIKEGYDRKSWLIFASGIKHAKHIAAMMQSLGVDARAVHSKMDDSERDEIIADFKAYKLHCVVNYGVLTTGFDHPGLDLIAVLRATTSSSLWVQMLGRGMRPSLDTGKVNCLCIAKGQRVLTDKGLIPIEKVTKQMKVWDGACFVSHDGVILRGIKDTITYAGLRATPNHKVWTSQGWQTFGKCAYKQIGIAITGNFKQTIQQTEGYFTDNYTQRKKQKSLFTNSMRRMLSSVYYRLHKSNSKESKLQAMRESKINTQMVKQQNYSGQTTLHKSKRFKICGLRRKRNRISIQVLFGNGFVYSNKFRITQGIANRSNRQQQTLRSRKLKINNSSSKYEKSETFWKKTEVFDIVNCGPNNQFTVEGLLVHNCLDFAGNTLRLGPINDPVIPKKKGQTAGVAPVRICEECGTYNHARSTVCINCGAVFEFNSKLTYNASTAALIKTEDDAVVQAFNVRNVIYNRYEKHGSPAMIRVDYWSDLQQFSEYICFEHSGFAAKKARDWWRSVLPGEPPVTTDQALLHLSQAKMPRQIMVHTNTKYPQVIARIF